MSLRRRVSGIANMALACALAGAVAVVTLLLGALPYAVAVAAVVVTLRILGVSL